MKRIILLALLLPSVAMAVAWDIGQDATGQGKMLVDSLYSIGIIRTNTIGSYSGAAITVAATDTLKSTLQKAGTLSALAGAKISGTASDTVWIGRSGIGTEGVYIYSSTGTLAGYPSIQFRDSSAGAATVSRTIYLDGPNATLQFPGSTIASVTSFSSLGVLTTKARTDTTFAYKRVIAGTTYMDSASGSIRAPAMIFDTLAAAPTAIQNGQMYFKYGTKDTVFVRMKGAWVVLKAEP